PNPARDWAHRRPDRQLPVPPLSFRSRGWLRAITGHDAVTALAIAAATSGREGPGMKGEAQQYQPSRVMAGVLFLLIGTAFLLESFLVWRVQLVDLWPLFLVAFGTAVLLGRVRRTKVEEDRSAQLAVAEERVRIARELHDIVAHGVSLMTIQIAAARRVVDTKREAANQSLEAAEETGRQSLA